MLCRWRLFLNRCATLSFSRALCYLFNRVINLRISVFFLHYLLRVSAWLHRWTDCSTQGDTFCNFQLPATESRHWLCSVRFRPNGLHFLLLALQWCWNQPLSLKKMVWGMSGDLLLKWEQGQIWWRTGIKIWIWYTMNCKWAQIFSFFDCQEVSSLVWSFKNVITFTQNETICHLRWEFNWFKSKKDVFKNI